MPLIILYHKAEKIDYLKHLMEESIKKELKEYNYKPLFVKICGNITNAEVLIEVYNEEIDNHIKGRKKIETKITSNMFCMNEYSLYFKLFLE